MDFLKIREHLLEKNLINEYKDILSFFQNPYGTITDESRDVLKELGYPDFENSIVSWNRNNVNDYREKVLLGQVIIWQEILNTYEMLLSVRDRINHVNIVVFRDNYMKASQEVIRSLNIYSEAKAAITTLEIHLGVDRYLDQIVQKDFELLVSLFDEIHKKVEVLLKEYKIIFQTKWNTGEINRVILHKLIRKNMNNQVCSLFQGNKKRTILFIIDGFGMGQYLWSQKVVPQNQNLAYSNNIFSWLEKNSSADVFTLAAPIITDTAAGISQIFTGCTGKDTRIFASTVKKESYGGPVQIKQISEYDFHKLCSTDNTSFTVDVSAEKDHMKIYYCSKYNSDNASGFSKYVFDGASVKSIIPPERVYAFLLEDLQHDESGATVVYITSIDNSGHVMGSFSQFERYEHEKINSLFRNFLIELAGSSPDVFDGNTSIIITADHGMTESYRINISRDNIIDELSSLHCHPKVIEANRAELIYGISPSKIEAAKTLLKSFFTNKNIDVMILSKEDSLYKEFIPRGDYYYENTSPDIIILFVSEGIFYSRNVGEKLMHFGGHGGHSVDEVFVPLINIELNTHLLTQIRDRYLNLQ